jgi:hypothetical protein
VVVDNEGNITIPDDDMLVISTDFESSPSDNKSYKELAFDFDTPTRPGPPQHQASTPSSITVKWEAPLGTIDMYEVQFKRSDANIKGTLPWRTLTRPSDRVVTLDSIACATEYIFRVRAHNPVGWYVRLCSLIVYG